MEIKQLEAPQQKDTLLNRVKIQQQWIQINANKDFTDKVVQREVNPSLDKEVNIQV